MPFPTGSLQNSLKQNAMSAQRDALTAVTACAFMNRKTLSGYKNITESVMFCLKKVLNGP